MECKGIRPAWIGWIELSNAIAAGLCPSVGRSLCALLFQSQQKLSKSETTAWLHVRVCLWLVWCLQMTEAQE